MAWDSVARSSNAAPAGQQGVHHMQLNFALGSEALPHVHWTHSSQWSCQFAGSCRVCVPCVCC